MTARTLIVYQCGPLVVIEDCDEAQRPFTRSLLTPESAVRIGEQMAALGMRILARRRRNKRIADAIRCAMIDAALGDA
jgi:hypothetical protein